MEQVQQLVDMGFAEADARRALSQVNNVLEQAIERLLLQAAEAEPTPASVSCVERVEDQLAIVPVTPALPSVGNAASNATSTNPTSQRVVEVQDADLSVALEMSIQEQRECLEPMAASLRQEGLPCGLRNVGNTCYVNSFLQTLLHIDVFRDWMLRYRAPAQLARACADSKHGVADVAEIAAVTPEPEAEHASGNEAQSDSLREHCIGLASELRNLCAYSLFTERNCIDPSRLLKELVDERGQTLQIGTQEDVGEFMLKLLDRLDEGVRTGSFAVVDSQPTSTGEELAEPLGVERELCAAKLGEADKEEKDTIHPTLLQSLFFGKQVQYFSYYEDAANEQKERASSAPDVEDGDSCSKPSSPTNLRGENETGRKLVVSEEKSDFLQIFLDVRHQDLYTAWEAANHTEVEYKTPSGATTTASTSISVERLPKLMFFQLQRVVFDQESKTQVKLDETFEFDTTIYVDRFLSENREEASQISAKVLGLRKRQRQLSEALASFENYQGRQGLNVQEVLDWAARCIEDNAACMQQATSKLQQPKGVPELEQCDPHSLISANVEKASELASCLLQEASPAAELLRGVRNACQLQAELLREELDKLTQQISGAYRHLQKHPFELYALWVHQGIAGSGHYWAYLRDEHLERWIRFDDAVVSIVPWEEVSAAALGQEGSNTSAYILVYMEKDLAVEHHRLQNQSTKLAGAEASLPPKLLAEIRCDNSSFKEENSLWAENHAERELRQHAEAIFQHYAGLIHRWEPMKRKGDAAGNPCDANRQKYLYDPALLQFELFLYRLHREQEVWTYLIMQSIDEQRKARQWRVEDEGFILNFLAETLRAQKCYASMLKEQLGGPQPQCELVPLDLPKLTAQYNNVLLQAHIVDEALHLVKSDPSRLVDTIGALALVWARWNLEVEDKFRQNEVLLVMSTLIFNTVNVLERHRRDLSDECLAVFQPACEYFVLLLHAVEWPKNWKVPLVQRVQGLFPEIVLAANKLSGGTHQVVQKEQILAHPKTQAQAHWESYEVQCLQPSQEFFERHRSLYAWVMQRDEAIAQEFVITQAPKLKELLVGAT